ncbi:hypothetical protein TA3x_004212 [Tundrisphaera sp. TA3]|uniref:hypothetical protein n=1 Tax=Tundrisphaera sp. TA3 TaxID=3435775 RepID=UPI003EBDFC3D
MLTFLAIPISVYGCAHRRQIHYPGRPGAPVRVDTTKGVRVRAPFVDVQVPAREPTLDIDGIEPEDD